MIVCGGTYKVQAVVTKSLALIGRRGATIDARGQKPISKKLPGGSGVVVFGTRHVEVTGFTVGTRASTPFSWRAAAGSWSRTTC